jgi:hypothetical protein
MLLDALFFFFIGGAVHIRSKVGAAQTGIAMKRFHKNLRVEKI